jgi:hypothetical protein
MRVTVKDAASAVGQTYESGAGSDRHGDERGILTNVWVVVVIRSQFFSRSEASCWASYRFR